uniref:Histone H1 n=1 Tax=mine drainage metagenome TaxID=410659 RepID=E6PCL4_9ZZZZ
MTGDEPRLDAPEKDPAAVALGRRGGLKGGKARAEALTPEQRKESAQKAAQARWGTKPPKP